MSRRARKLRRAGDLRGGCTRGLRARQRTENGCRPAHYIRRCVHSANTTHGYLSAAEQFLSTQWKNVASRSFVGQLSHVDKVWRSAEVAVEDVADGATIAVGGFGLCGIPSVLIAALLARGTRDIEVVSNNAGVDDWGLGLLLGAGRLRRVVASYVGENKEFARQYLAGELELELTPQGTLAERMRAGGSGIAAFYTRTGTGTQVAEGGMPWKYDSDGNVDVESPPKPVALFDEVEYVLERAIIADYGLVRAWKGDRHGNLVFRGSARNFNPLAAMCGRITIAEVEHLVEPGELNANDIHTPGAYVHRVISLTHDQALDKRIEKRIVR